MERSARTRPHIRETLNQSFIDRQKRTAAYAKFRERVLFFGTTSRLKAQRETGIRVGFTCAKLPPQCQGRPRRRRRFRRGIAPRRLGGVVIQRDQTAVCFPARLRSGRARRHAPENENDKPRHSEAAHQRPLLIKSHRDARQSIIPWFLAKAFSHSPTS